MTITFGGRPLPTLRGTPDHPNITTIGSGAGERLIVSYRDRKPGSLNGPDPYRMDCEAHEFSYDPETDPIGYGSTEAAAIDDLLTQIEEREE